MNLIRRHLVILLIAATLPSLANAYVEPGNGHLLLQLFLAFVAGALFYMKSIVDWFRGVSKDSEFDTGEIGRETTTQNTNGAAMPANAVAASPRKRKKSATTKKKPRTRKTATRKKAS